MSEVDPFEQQRIYYKQRLANLNARIVELDAEINSLRREKSEYESFIGGLRKSYC